MYALQISRRAERDLERLDWLVAHVDQVEHDALKGPLAGTFKLRVGDYRVFYDLDRDANIIIIERVKHRSEAYR